MFRADADIQTLKLNNYPGFIDDAGRSVNNGIFHNYNLGLTLARNNINDPIFPKSGSLVSLKVQMTPPYSLFKDASFYQTANVNELYRFVEYVKWRFDAELKISPIVGKLTLKTSTKIGILGRWQQKNGTYPLRTFRPGWQRFEQPELRPERTRHHQFARL